LHQFGELLRNLLSAVPLPAVRVLFVALPAAILVWVVTQPRLAEPEDESRGSARKGWSTDLRFWAAAALIVQILIYALV
jgi:hypothetical protein